MSKYEKDHTILHQNNYNYKFSFDELVKLNDYIIDFKLFNSSNSEGIIKCDDEKLVKLVNDHYTKIEPIKRFSAKVISSDNPRLVEDGVKRLII